jgi:hypothetical protein
MQAGVRISPRGAVMFRAPSDGYLTVTWWLGGCCLWNGAFAFPGIHAKISAEPHIRANNKD